MVLPINLLLPFTQVLPFTQGGPGGESGDAVADVAFLMGPFAIVSSAESRLQTAQLRSTRW
jgi:hypothetical protein